MEKFKENKDISANLAPCNLRGLLLVVDLHKKRRWPYTQGLSIRAIARLIEVSPSAVLTWIKTFAKTHYEKPAPGDAILVELDEMWHYVKSKKTSYGYGKPIVERLENSSTGSVEEGIKQRYQN